MIEARRAADLLGATKMDRPEDVEANPRTNKVYAMLTNNIAPYARAGRRRQPARQQPLRPHRRDDPRTAAITPPTKFAWEILVKCGDPSIAAVGATFSPATTKDGWFGMPDNCAFDNQGRLWIATDGNQASRTGRSDGLWAMETEGEARATSKHFFRCPERRRDVRPRCSRRTTRRSFSPPASRRSRTTTIRTPTPASYDDPLDPLAGLQAGHATAPLDRGHDETGRRQDRGVNDSGLGHTPTPSS